MRWRPPPRCRRSSEWRPARPARPGCSSRCPRWARSCCSSAGRRTDRWGHLLGVAPSSRPSRTRWCCSSGRSRCPPRSRCAISRSTTGSRSASLNVEFGLRLDPLSLTFALLITGVGSLIHIYSVGYMSHDPNRRKFFAQLNLFVAAMLVLVLGNGFVTLYLGWEGVGLASYLLIGFYTRAPLGGQRGEEGVPDEPRRRRRSRDRDLHPLPRARDHPVRRGLRPRRGDLARRADRDHPAPAARRVRQVGPVPAAGLAPGRHGGPDAGVGADPRGDDGHRRRLPHRPVEPALRPGADRAARRHDRRGDHAADRRDHRLRVRRHQEGPRVLHGQPDRLHDAGRRARPGRLRRGAGPPVRPRLLQGGAVPRGRLGDARDGRRDRHAPVRRPPAPHAGDVLDVHPRLPRPDRLPVPLRLLHQGPDHRGRADRGAGGGLAPRRCGAARGRADGVLHDAPDAHDLLRRGALAGPHARGASTPPTSRTRPSTTTRTSRRPR